MIVCSTFSTMIEKKINYYYSEDIRKFWYKPHIFEWYYDEISSFHKDLDIFKSANYAANMIVCSTFSPMIEKKINYDSEDITRSVFLKTSYSSGIMMKSVPSTNISTYLVSQSRYQHDSLQHIQHND
jgi:hypothetical protein